MRDGDYLVDGMDVVLVGERVGVDYRAPVHDMDMREQSDARVVGREQRQEGNAQYVSLP